MKRRFFAATVACVAICSSSASFASSGNDVLPVTGDAKIMVFGGQPLPASVLRELKAKQAMSHHKTHRAAQADSGDTFPPPTSAKPTVGIASPDSAEAKNAPANTQMKTQDGKYYYYDENHEFHPGIVPDKSSSTSNSTQDIMARNNNFTASTESNVGQMSTSGNVGHTVTSAPPVGSDGQPLMVYNESQENKKAELNEALRHLLPDPSDITETRHRQADVRRADAAPLTQYKPVIRSINLSLAPGNVPPVIHLAYGVTTSIAFSDVTGAPWYINKAIADNSSYGVVSTSGDDTEKTNILTVVPSKEYTEGRNLTVFLEHSALPVIFQLETGVGSSVDYRVDTTVMQRGPNARADYVENTLEPVNDETTQKFVDGTPPSGARRLKTDNSSVEAWRYQKFMFIRTSVPMLSPNPIQKGNANISGIRVYKIRPIPEIVVSNRGILMDVRIGD